MNKIDSQNWFIYLLAVIASLTGILLINFFSYNGIFIIIALVLAFVIFGLIIKNSLWGFLLLIFSLPFERIPTIDVGLVTLKVNQFLALSVLIAWILSVIFEKRKIISNPLTWPIILFIFANLISIFHAGNVERAFQVFIFIFFMAIISFLVVNMVSTEDILKKVLKTILYTSIFICIFGVYQFFGDLIGLSSTLTGLKEGYTKAVFGFPRIMAFSNEPLYLANFLLIPLGVSAALFFSKDKFIPKIYLFLTLLLMLLVFILTVSRGAYAGLGAMALFLILFFLKKIFTWKNIVIGLLAITIVLGGTYYFLSRAEPQALDEFIGHITVNDISAGESTQGRLQSYQVAYDIFLDNPINGIGVGNYGPYVKNFPDSADVSGWDIVNNEYLEIMAETGLVGIITFVLILLVIFFRSYMVYFRTKNEFLKTILLGLVAALIGVLVQYNFFSTLYIMHIWVLIGLIIAVQNISINDPLTNKQ
jgi:O-antigen ligase